MNAQNAHMSSTPERATRRNATNERRPFYKNNAAEK